MDSLANNRLPTEDMFYQEVEDMTLSNQIEEGKQNILDKYITFYTRHLRDRFPSWIELITVKEEIIISNLIDEFYINRDKIDEIRLKSLEKRFLDISKIVLDKISKETNDEILCEHFQTIKDDYSKENNEQSRF